MMSILVLGNWLCLYIEQLDEALVQLIDRWHMKAKEVQHVAKMGDELQEAVPMTVGKVSLHMPTV